MPEQKKRIVSSTESRQSNHPISNHRKRTPIVKMQRLCIALLFAVCAGIAVAQQSSGETPNETAVWKLEFSYWDDVKALDLVSYRALWHADFIGWPFVSPAPQHKDHITDWIDQYTAKGLHLGLTRSGPQPATQPATSSSPTTGSPPPGRTRTATASRRPAASPTPGSKHPPHRQAGRSSQACPQPNRQPHLQNSRNSRIRLGAIANRNRQPATVLH